MGLLKPLFEHRGDRSAQDQAHPEQVNDKRPRRSAVSDAPSADQAAPTDDLAYLLREAALVSQQSEQANDQAATSAAIDAWERVIVHPFFTGLDAVRQAAALSSAGNAYQQRYRAGRDAAALDSAVRLNRHALQCIPASSTERWRCLLSLGSVLHDRYRGAKEPADLEEAIFCFQQAAEAAPPESPELARSLHDLGIGLRDRYTAAQQPSDLDAAIKVFRQGAELVAGDLPRLFRYLSDLAWVLDMRASATKRGTDFDEASEVYGRCVELLSPRDPTLGGYLLNLSNCLRGSCTDDGGTPDLDKSIVALQRLIAARASPAAPFLDQLGLTLYQYYIPQVRLAFLQAGARCCSQAVQAAHEEGQDAAIYLVHLRLGLEDLAGRGIELRKRYSTEGNTEDLAQSIRLLEEAVRLARDPLDRLAYLNDLGNSLYERYHLSGVGQELADLLDIRQRVVRDSTADSPGHPGRLNNLGLALRDLFVRTGKVEDLDEAIADFRAAVAQASSPDFLSNLGKSLEARYDLKREVTDLEEAIQALRTAAAQTPANAPDRPLLLSNLAECLRRHQSSTNAEDGTDSAEAIQLAREAVRETPLESPDRPQYLNVLGNCLSDRSAYCKQGPDLDETVAAYQQAVAATPEQSPYLPAYLNNVATALADRYQSTRHAEDWQAAQDAFRRAYQLGQERMPQEAVRSVDNWCGWGFKLRAWNAVIEAYQCGQQSLGLLLGRQLQRQDKEVWLGKVQRLSACAAYALAKLDRREEAVMAIEAGRARLLTEALEQNQRTLRHLSELGCAELYERYRQASERLYALQRAGVGASRPDGYLGLRQQQDTAHSELVAVIADIRQVPGYAEFGSGMPDIESIRQAVPAATSLVYLLTTVLGGLALIVPGVKDQAVETVWLDRLTDAAVRELLVGSASAPAPVGYLGAYAASRETNEPAAQDAWAAAIKTTSHWLWDMLMGPVVAQLGRCSGSDLTVRREDHNSRWPAAHVVLVPGGLLGLLPLHLAWRQTASQERCVLDDLVVSYAPGAQALGIACDRATESERQAPRLLAVVNPGNNLPFSPIEAQQVIGCFAEGTAQTLEGPQATQDALVQALPGHTYLHFDCHGRYDPAEVLNSSLMLAHGNPLELREILDQSFVLDEVRLITLSACESGLIDIRRVPDEAVGLPAGFLQAGAPGVVSTLWAVDDLSTALLMGEFYRRHLKQGQSVAKALCGAQLWLRDATAKELKLAEYYKGAFGASGNQDSQALHSERHWTRHPDSKPFADPCYWAAFVFTGA